MTVKTFHIKHFKYFAWNYLLTKRITRSLYMMSEIKPNKDHKYLVIDFDNRFWKVNPKIYCFTKYLWSLFGYISNIMCKHLVIHFVIKVYARNSVFKEVICTICSYAHHKSKYEGAYIHLYNCHVSVSKWWTLEQLDFSSILLPSWKVLPYSWQLVTTRKSVFFFF